MTRSTEKSRTQPIDVSIIYQMMRDMRQEVLDSIKEIKTSITDLSARVAIAQKDVIKMTETMTVISANDAASRVARLQSEVAEQERERKVLENRIRIVDERLEEKKTATVGALNTTGKMMAAAELTYEQREKLEQDARDAVWAKRRELIITAIMVSTSVGVVGSVITAIIWFINFYMSNR